MNSTEHKEISKFLSYVLRHEPQAIGIQLDSEGWAEIDSLISGAAKNGHSLDRETILAVATSSDKKRFSVSADAKYIRAVQGHSTETVTVKHLVMEPPAFLFHGTATRFLDSIRDKGLIPGLRHHVHLTEDEKIAVSVGQRYGTPRVLKIEAMKMQQEGFIFFQAENGVWLTKHVPPNFIIDDK